MNSLLILIADLNANFNRLHKKRGQMTNTHTHWWQLTTKAEDNSTGTPWLIMPALTGSLVIKHNYPCHSVFKHTDYHISMNIYTHAHTHRQLTLDSFGFPCSNGYLYSKSPLFSQNSSMFHSNWHSQYLVHSAVGLKCGNVHNTCANVIGTDSGAPSSQEGEASCAGFSAADKADSTFHRSKACRWGGGVN